MNLKKEDLYSYPVLELDHTLAEASHQLLKHHLSEINIINEKGHFVGTISKTHLVEALARNISASSTIKELLTSLPHINNEAGPQRLDNREQPHLIGFELIIDSVYNPVISIDASGNIQVFNRAAEKLVDLKAEDVRGRNIKEVFTNTKLLEVMETGVVQSIQKIVLGNKTFISNRTPIIRDGVIVGAVGVLQEVSELEAISKELAYTKKLNQELDAIIESSFDGLYITDGLGNTLRVNKATERITGVLEEEVIGRNMADLVKDKVFSRSGSLLALEKKETVTTELDTKTGKTLLVTSTPIFDDDQNIFRVVTNVRDITELNHLKQRLEHMEDLSRVYHSELQHLKLKNSKRIVYGSSKMEDIIKLAIRLSEFDSTVLIQGESGVGKELMAEIIHSNSSRKDKPFIKINCGAIPENLLETELFGYEAGAFTGASKGGKVGLFELADGGVLFLDEIGEMPLNLQVKLLRFVQDQTITRVGGVRPIRVNVRILAGTNRDLTEMISYNHFRQDLYYRLNVVPLVVPPLRKRKEDIPLLAQHFLNVYNKKYQLRKRLTHEVLNSILAYDWPGNVRELENLMERLVVVTANDTITRADLPAWAKNIDTLADCSESEILTLKEAVEKIERQVLEKAFSRYKSTYEIAKVLNVNQSTVVRKASKYKIKNNHSRCNQ